MPTAGAWPPKRIGIVGLGLIGRSLAMAVRRAWPAVEIFGVERAEILARPDRPSIVDQWVSLTGLHSCDLVVLAAPVSVSVDALARLAVLRFPGLVTDVGSTKRDFRAAADRAGAGLRAVGGHPMAGNETGVADGDLFQSKTWFLVACRDSRPDDIQRIEQLIDACGGRPVRIEADAHDRVMAAVSHLPQLVASLLMQTVGERVGPRGLAHAGRGLVDTTRLASCGGDWLPELFAANADHVGTALDDLIARLQAVRGRLTAQDDLRRVISEAQSWRDTLCAARRDP